MANIKLSPKLEDVLFVKDQRRKNFHSKPFSGDKNQFRSEEHPKMSSKSCYSPTNVTSLVHQDEASVDTHAFINYDEEWIVDSDCSHHATGNDTLLSDVHQHHMKRSL
ncbi:hypothetical protein V6N11_040006 [Hibiscus sabdariffa]|uniref:Uncharacterized protein n=1 Tax=Hibiscus sabdariffa TaxID=183260 RepID=A0ABR2RG63_9ROSI